MALLDRRRFGSPVFNLQRHRAARANYAFPVSPSNCVSVVLSRQRCYIDTRSHLLLSHCRSSSPSPTDFYDDCGRVPITSSPDDLTSVEPTAALGWLPSSKKSRSHSRSEPTTSRQYCRSLDVIVNFAFFIRQMSFIVSSLIFQVPPRATSLRCVISCPVGCRITPWRYTVQ